MKKTYSEKLLDPRWQKKRLLIFDRDDWKCTKCNKSKNTLHIHHEKYYKNPWNIPNKYLKTLCELCHWNISNHKKVHDKFMLAIWNKTKKNLQLMVDPSFIVYIYRFFHLYFNNLKNLNINSIDTKDVFDFLCKKLNIEIKVK